MVDGWCMVCIGKEVDNEVMVVYEKTNGWSKLQSLMGHDKLGDMGHFVPIRKYVY